MGTKESHRGPSGKDLPGLELGAEEAMARLRAFFPRTRVVLAYLFGSCARGEAKPSSDVDIAVLLAGHGEELYANYRELILGIRDALGTERFDLLLLNDAAPTMRFAVITTGRLLYAQSDQELNAFEADTIRTYQDTAHLRAVQNDYLRRRAQEWSSATKA